LKGTGFLIRIIYENLQGQTEEEEEEEVKG